MLITSDMFKIVLVCVEKNRIVIFSCIIGAPINLLVIGIGRCTV